MTSCALNPEGFQIGMALVERKSTREGTRIGIFPEAKPTFSKRREDIPLGERVPLHEEAVVISRFPAERLQLEGFREVLEK